MKRDEEKTTAYKGSVQYHTVEPGETLYSIARKYNVSPEQLLRLNHYPSNKKVIVGEKVRYS